MHPVGAPCGAPAVPRPAVELADIVRLHGEALRLRRALTPDQLATLRAIERCRTAALGGHLDVCTGCGHERPSYNSCRNRHCPKCQALAQARWVEARSERLLPVPYFHVVFTLPAELRAVAKLNRRAVFDAMFATVSATLLQLGVDPKRLGGLLGVTAVLHTWRRDLAFHPHIHCIVTGGGWSIAEQRWLSARAGYLLPVAVLGSLFRGKLLAALGAAHAAGKLRLPDEHGPVDPEGFARLCAMLRRKRWHVYCKPPFGGPEQVLRYLGRYTHRVGISNRRLISLDERGVTFRTKDGKVATLGPVAFLERFVEHVLPAGFVKIRHYGLLAPSNVSTCFTEARAALCAPTATTANEPTAESSTEDPARSFSALLLELTGIDLGICPACSARAMLRRPLPAARAPPAKAA
jgi:hypothetical protein